MIKHVARCLVWAALFAIFSSFFNVGAMAGTDFVEGKDFKFVPVDLSQEDNQAKADKIEIIEFFSLGCPWCAYFDPAVAQWEKYLSKDIVFKRVHVTFESEVGRELAKIFYTAQSLGLVPNINEKLFQLVQKNSNKPDEATLAKFFEDYHVEKKKFLSSFHFSTGLNTLILRGEALTRRYKIIAIPTVVVDGKYQVDSAMAGGDVAKFLDTIQFLINKARKARAPAA